MRQLLLIAAALNGLAAVAIGAAAQHLWAGDPAARMLAETGVRYGLPHAGVLIALALLPAPGAGRAQWLQRTSGLSLALGTTLFSGSLYARAAGAGAAVAGVAPVGGSLMILGWALLLGLAAVSLRRS